MIVYINGNVLSEILYIYKKKTDIRIHHHVIVKLFLDFSRIQTYCKKK